MRQCRRDGGRCGHTAPYLIARELHYRVPEVLTWSAWEVLGWLEHFGEYPPSTETGDLLMAIITRMEAIAQVKPNQRTPRWNVSRFYRDPSTRPKTKAEQKREQRQLRDHFEGIEIKPKET